MEILFSAVIVISKIGSNFSCTVMVEEVKERRSVCTSFLLFILSHPAVYFGLCAFGYLVLEKVFRCFI